mgnify:CR=1 FL=1
MKMSAKKVLGLVLAGVLAAGSLTACGGGGTAATTADTKAEATTAAGDAKAESDAAADTTAADSGEKKDAARGHGVCICSLQLDPAR